MRDDRRREWSLAGRAKQNPVSGGSRIDRFEHLHFGPERRIGWRSKTARRIKSSVFLVGEPNARSAEKPCCEPRRLAKRRPERPARQRLVLFRDNRTPKLMQKIHRLTDN
jgi:hypothetical protein